MARTSSILCLVLFLVAGSACAPVSYFNEWIGWKKYKDAPGISYRLRCMGSAFTGSRFSRYEVELFNHYPDPVSLRFFMSGEANDNRSEMVRLRMQSSTRRKVNLYNVRTGCIDSARLHIEEIYFRP